MLFNKGKKEKDTRFDNVKSWEELYKATGISVLNSEASLKRARLLDSIIKSTNDGAKIEASETEVAEAVKEALDVTKDLVAGSESEEDSAEIGDDEAPAEIGDDEAPVVNWICSE